MMKRIKSILTTEISLDFIRIFIRNNNIHLQYYKLIHCNKRILILILSILFILISFLISLKIIILIFLSGLATILIMQYFFSKIGENNKFQPLDSKFSFTSNRSFYDFQINSNSKEKISTYSYSEEILNSIKKLYHHENYELKFHKYLNSQNLKNIERSSYSKSNEKINFAIPSSFVKNVINSAKTKEKNILDDKFIDSKIKYISINDEKEKNYEIEKLKEKTAKKEVKFENISTTKKITNFFPKEVEKLPSQISFLTTKKHKNPHSKHKKDKHNERTINEFQIQKNEILNIEAHSNFKELGIGEEINNWISNCRHWIFFKMIPKILYYNYQNINELNSILYQNYGKKLREEKFILPDSNKSIIKIEKIEYIVIDELITMYKLSKNNGFQLETKYPIDENEAVKLRCQLFCLIEKRIFFDKYLNFGKEEFDRISILNKLARFYHDPKSRYYHQEEIVKESMTDTEIIANLFSNYINYELFPYQSNSYYKNFVVEGSSNTNSNNKLFLRQINEFNFEPHYEVSADEHILKAIPGINNLYCSISLFFYHIKEKLKNNFGEDKQELLGILSEIFKIN